MGRLYTVSFSGITGSSGTPYDMFEISPADDKNCGVLGILLGQSSERGDSQEQLVRYQVIRGHNTSGSGGQSATPRRLNSSDAAASFSAEVMNDTIASGGNPFPLIADTFNIRSGLQLMLPPELVAYVKQTSDITLVLRLMDGTTNNVTWSGTLFIDEN